MASMKKWSLRPSEACRRARGGNGMPSRAVFGFAVPLAAAALIVGNLTPGPKVRGSRQKVGARAYAVYDAALTGFLKGVHGYIIIGDFTSSLRCGARAKNGFQMGGCGGMRVPGESPRRAIDSIRSALPGLGESAINDFLRKNTRPVPLQHKFALPIRYVLYGPAAQSEIPKRWGAPVFAFYLSRVGFSGSGKQALVFVNHISWKNRSLSGGEYLLLGRKKSRWTVQASRSFWNLKGRRPAPSSR